MNGASHSFAITPSDLLARFITVKKWVREDLTIRQDAFIPPRDLNFSATRHGELSETELWRIGQNVANAVSESRNAALHGRADFTHQNVVDRNLQTEPAPLPENPNHVHIVGWPTDKPAQKILAQQLAAAARYIRPPASVEA
jgi:hypothetical protein